MYPLNMTRKSDSGFAVANDEADHKALTDAGYGPGYVAPPPPAPILVTREDLVAQAKAMGIKVHKDWSDEHLAQEIASAA